ncbi:hypothetical protein [Microlunatus sp. GCM10028923]|uniref:hypothetical protein n=1 Tax=Microlunatus sp. GCM10028923 TaxID=3273400 RepID=UPI00361BA6B9
MSPRAVDHVLVLILVLIMLGGCTTDSGDGYVTETVDRLSVDRPTGWDTEQPVESPWSKGFRAAPDDTDQLQLSGDFGSYATAAQGMGTLVGQAQVGLSGFSVVESREVEVEGATTAQLTRYTVTDGDRTLTGVWIVAAHWPYPQSVAVSLLTAEDDPTLTERLVESMKLQAVTG